MEKCLGKLSMRIKVLEPRGRPPSLSPQAPIMWDMDYISAESCPGVAGPGGRSDVASAWMVAYSSKHHGRESVVAENCQAPFYFICINLHSESSQFSLVPLSYRTMPRA